LYETVASILFENWVGGSWVTVHPLLFSPFILQNLLHDLPTPQDWRHCSIQRNHIFKTHEYNLSIGSHMAWKIFWPACTFLVGWWLRQRLWLPLPKLCLRHVGDSFHNAYQSVESAIFYLQCMLTSLLLQLWSFKWRFFSRDR
jgi:hypothetical protein